MKLTAGFYKVAVSVEISLGTKLPKLRVSVRTLTDLALVHSCTCAFLASQTLCTLDHPTIASALAPDVPLKKRLAFDTVVRFCSNRVLYHGG